MKRVCFGMIVVPVLMGAGAGLAQSPFASRVLDYSPAPGQFVQNGSFNDPNRALGAPTGGGSSAANNGSVVSLGGFGGSITLGFDQTVRDDRLNPLGMDAIVFGNAFWIGGANRHAAECGYIEISVDVNGNQMADDAWYLIPGSHIVDPDGQWQSQVWDDDVADATNPPHHPAWIPLEESGSWQTSAYRLPGDIFDAGVIENPNGPFATEEGIYGYVDYSPTLLLGDMNGDDTVDDALMPAERFYTVPDDPLVVGVSPGSGGGDAFDIAWAIDAETLQPANLDGFDFIRITNGVHRVHPALGESSTEIDGVADVRPMVYGDADGDGDVDVDDWYVFVQCQQGAVPADAGNGCAVMDIDGDSDVDSVDAGGFQRAFTGEWP